MISAVKIILYFHILATLIFPALTNADTILPPTNVHSAYLGKGVIKIWWLPSKSNDIKEYHIYHREPDKFYNYLSPIAIVDDSEQSWTSKPLKTVLEYFGRF